MAQEQIATDKGAATFLALEGTLLGVYREKISNDSLKEGFVGDGW